MNEVLSFSIDYYKVLEDDPYITLLELYVVSEGSNRHDTYFDLSSIEDAIPSLPNKPLLAIWDSSSNDVKEHARNKIDFEKQDCVGNIPESLDAQIVDYKEKKFLKCKACVWKHYNPKISELLRNNTNTKISMEIELLESYKDVNDGFMHITKFRFMGITLLGMKYLEAIPNANAKIIKYSTADYSDMVNNTNKQLSQFSIPESMKENAKKALELTQKNPQLINFAKDIINNETLSFSKVGWILNKIQNLKKEDNIIFFGGVESKEWCEGIIQKFNMDQIKQEKEEEKVVLKENEEKVQLKFGLNSSQIREILNNNLAQYKYKCGDCEWGKYYVEAYDEEFVYVWDCEDSINKSMTYTLVENVASIDIASAQEVISAGYMPVGTKEDEPSDDLEVIDYKAKFDEMSAKYEEMCGKYEEMCGKYSALETESTEKYALIDGLQSFKAETEKKDLENKANELYSKYDSYITEDEKQELNVKLFSVDNFDTFKEKVFAIVTPKMEAENIALKQNIPNADTNAIKFSTMPLLDNLNKDDVKSSFEKLKEYANS